MARVAIITGGASGMGLAVAQALAARGGWELHLIDLNQVAGKAAASSLPCAHFHRADATNYTSLAAAFKEAFESSNGQLHFVFANAGIAERDNFYKKHDTGADPPPEPDMLVTKICFDAAITTSHLAQHYFRQSKDKQDQCLIMTASCGGIYPSYYSPMYSGSKHGVIGFMRSISKHFWEVDRIRVNAICPGVVKTNLLTQNEWKNFPEEYFTPVDKIVQGVLILVDGKDETSTGKTRIDDKQLEKKGILWGEAMEFSGWNHYYRVAPMFCDQGMEAVMKATDIEELQ